VLHRLGHLDRLKATGSEHRGPCPVHGCDDDHHRSFSANIEKNVFCCFSPSCGAKGNVLDLWAAVHKLPLREAALDLVATFHLAVSNAEKRQPVTPSRNPLGLLPLQPENTTMSPNNVTPKPS